MKKLDIVMGSAQPAPPKRGGALPALAMLAIALLLTACGAAKYDSAAEGSDYAMKSESSANYDYPQEAVSEEMADYDSGYYGEEAEAPMMAGGTEANVTAAASAGQDGAQGQDRKLIKNVNLELETTEYDALYAGIEQKISFLGGYVEESSTNGNIERGVRKYGNIVARIPSARVDEFVEQVDGMSNVTFKSESVQDITLQYVDVESRKKSLEVERDRLLKLMETAETVSDIIEIEGRLSEVRYQLESSASQLRVMDNQVDYSTVRIGISEVSVYTPPEERTIWQEISDEFAENLRSLGRFLKRSFIAIVAGLPQIIAFVIFVVIIAKLIKLIKRKGRLPKLSRPGKKNKTPEEEKPEEK